MSIPADDGLAVRFAALAPETGSGDWRDVKRRASRMRKRRLVTYAFAATVGMILVGCTTAFGPRVIDFFGSEQSPPHVIDFLGVVETANTYADPSFPGFDPKQTRRIVDEKFAAGAIQLDLTPLRGGGFCLTMRRRSATTEGDETDCATPSRQGKEPLVVQEPDGRVGTGGGRLGRHGGGAISLTGWITAPGLERLTLRYEDGSTEDVPHFHVTAPIGADFFLFDVPATHEAFPRRAVELRATDGDGNPIAGIPIYNTDPDEWTFPRYGNHGFPPAADRSLVKVLRFPGTRATIRIAPAKGGVTCFMFHLATAGSDACLRDEKTRAMFRLDEDSFFRTSELLLWGIVEPNVRRVELTFQDGAQAVATAREGFVVYELPTSRYPAGKRLVSATLRNATGHVVRRVRFDPDVRDRYPCDNPRDLGFGPPVCP